jgi:hypothetical protein
MNVNIKSSMKDMCFGRCLPKSGEYSDEMTKSVSVALSNSYGEDSTAPMLKKGTDAVMDGGSATCPRSESLGCSFNDSASQDS